MTVNKKQVYLSLELQICLVFQAAFYHLKGLKKLFVLEKRRVFGILKAHQFIFFLKFCVYLDLCPPRRGNYRNHSQKRQAIFFVFRPLASATA